MEFLRVKKKLLAKVRGGRCRACLMNRNRIEKVDNDVSNTLMARDYKGFGNQAMNGVIECQKVNQMK